MEQTTRATSLFKWVTIAWILAIFIALAGCHEPEVVITGETGAGYNATTWYVHVNGTNVSGYYFNGTNFTGFNFTSIQEAINSSNVSAGDIIRVLSNITQQVNVTKAVDIDCGSNTTIIGGFYVTADEVTVKNCNITTGYSFASELGDGIIWRAGILIDADYFRSQNNTVYTITGDDSPDASSPVTGGYAYCIYSGDAYIGHRILDTACSGVTGGNGGDATGAGSGGGGTGGNAYGLSIGNHAEIKNSTVSSLTGGNGGNPKCSSQTVAGAAGGSVYGIIVANYSLVANSSVSTLISGPAHSGCDDSAQNVNGRDGANAYGITCNNSIVHNTTISAITGGLGGDSPGDGSGGIGGKAIGYYVSATNNSLFVLRDNTINGLTGGASGMCAGIANGIEGGLAIGVHVPNSGIIDADVPNSFRNFTMNGLTGGAGGGGCGGAHVDGSAGHLESFRNVSTAFMPALLFPSMPGYVVAGETVSITWFAYTNYSNSTMPFFNLTYGLTLNTRETYTINGSVNSTASCTGVACSYSWNRSAVNGTIYLRVKEKTNNYTEDSNYALLLNYSSFAINSITITPSTAYSDNNLTCLVDVTNIEGLNISANFSWYRNGTINWTDNNVTMNSTSNSSVLLANWTAKGDVWNCSVYVYNTAQNSTGSTNRTISNSIPTTPTNLTYWNGTRPITYSAGAFTSYPDTYLECSGSTDADPDTLYYNIEILTNETAAGTSYIDELNVSYCSPITTLQFDPNWSLWNTTYDWLTEYNVTVANESACVFNATCTGRCPYNLSVQLNSTNAQYALIINGVNLSSTSQFSIATITTAGLLFNATLDFIQANESWDYEFNWTKGWT